MNRELVICPKCGNRFSKGYGRMIACGDCPHNALGCGHIRCPQCEHEFEDPTWPEWRPRLKYSKRS